MAVTPESVLRPDEIARLSPIKGIARGLPRSAYIDEAFFRLECERLFPREWVSSRLSQASTVSPSSSADPIASRTSSAHWTVLVRMPE